MFALDCFPPTNPEAIVNAKLAIAMAEAGWTTDVMSKWNSNSRYRSGGDKDLASLADIA